MEIKVHSWRPVPFLKDMEVIMADLNLQHKINIPFAQNGDKDEIPDTSEDGLVNNTDGLGVKYETPIGQGGEYYTREIINGALYKVYAAVKELQDLVVAAGFPIDMTKALNVLKIENGGTGKKTADEAYIALGGKALGKMDSIALTDNKLTGVLPISKGGTGKTSATESYAALGGKALGKMDSIALTDNKLTGILPVSKGGTGNSNGFNFQNFIDFKKLCSQINFTIGGTVLDFAKKLPYSCSFVTIIQAEYFQDSGTFGGILTVKKFDTNSTWLYLDRFSTSTSVFEFKQNIGVIQGARFSGWKTIRNTDGSIITGTLR